MFNVYPYSAASALMPQTDHTNSRNKRSRINKDDPWKEMSTMNSNIDLLEAHVRAVNTRRMQEALVAQQLRLSQHNRPGFVSKIIANVRLSTAMILIAAGERLRNGTPTETSIA